MTRREAREAVFGLLFETEFRMDETTEVIYRTSTENREIPDDAYIREVYFGVMDKREVIDTMIEKHAKGWKLNRMSRVSRAVMRLSTYEMMFMQNRVPMRVSINEAIELSKMFDGEKARGFINGILNAIKNEILSNKEQREANEKIGETDRSAECGAVSEPKCSESESFDMKEN